MNEDVEVLFRELAGLPEAAREDWYRNRRTPADIRAEVESLLRFDATGPRVPECVSEIAEDLIRSPEVRWGGSRCGPYRVLRLLGRGGAGAVFLSERADGEIEQQVAIKLLRFGSDDPSFRARFLRERQILASLSHPGIARLMDAGHTQDHQPYLVMEYIAGTPIDAYAEKLDVPSKLRLFLPVCEAVSYAHRNLVIHRDIKPGNILVDCCGQPRLLDFGIAKILDTAADETRTQDRLLTPDYASPEQLRGGPQGPATDIYSLGAVLYCLLTGHSPRAARGDGAGRMEQPPARTLNSAIPRDLDCILAKAMREDPRERYTSVECLENDLQAFLDSRPIQARSGENWYRIRKFARRRLAAACIAATLVLLGLLTLLFRHVSQPEENSVPIPVTSFVGREDGPTWSPDGREIAFTWNGENLDNFDIYVVKPGGSKPRQLTTDPGNDGAPAWSPDGRWIAYVHKAADDKQESLILVSPDGQSSETLFTTSGRLDRPSWSSGGAAIVFGMIPGRDQPAALYSMTLKSRAPRRITWPSPGIPGDIAAAVSPDNKMIAFVRKTAWRTAEIYLLPIRPDLTPAGAPHRVTSSGYAVDPAWTPDGTRIVFESHHGGFGLWQMDRSGKNQRPVFGISDQASSPTLTRGAAGRISLAFVNEIFLESIWRYPLGPHRNGSPPSVLAPSTYSQAQPRYSNSGARLAFTSDRTGSTEIWAANADGSQPVQLTNLHNEIADAGQWSPSDEAITFIARDRGQRQIFLVSASGGPAIPITNESGVSVEGAWAADGNGYYYTVKRSGNSEVWRVGRSGAPRMQITHNGGFAGFETRGGTFYYWRQGAHNTATLWTRNLNEDRQLPLDPPGHFGGWTSMAGTGFYYRAADTDNIYLYEEKSGRSRSVMTRKMPASFGDFTVSPDGRWLAAGVVVSDERNLLLMENFH